MLSKGLTVIFCLKAGPYATNRAYKANKIESLNVKVVKPIACNYKDKDNCGSRPDNKTMYKLKQNYRSICSKK